MRERMRDDNMWSNEYYVSFLHECVLKISGRSERVGGERELMIVNACMSLCVHVRFECAFITRLFFMTLHPIQPY